MNTRALTITQPAIKHPAISRCGSLHRVKKPQPKQISQTNHVGNNLNDSVIFYHTQDKTPLKSQFFIPRDRAEHQQTGQRLPIWYVCYPKQLRKTSRHANVSGYAMVILTATIPLMVPTMTSQWCPPRYWVPG